MTDTDLIDRAIERFHVLDDAAATLARVSKSLSEDIADLRDHESKLLAGVSASFGRNRYRIEEDSRIIPRVINRQTGFHEEQQALLSTTEDLQRNRARRAPSMPKHAANNGSLRRSS